MIKQPLSATVLHQLRYYAYNQINKAKQTNSLTSKQAYNWYLMIDNIRLLQRKIFYKSKSGMNPVDCTEEY
jgi:hypothetical protein